MKQFFQISIFAFLFIFASTDLMGQIIADPTTFTYEAKKIKDHEYKLIFHVKLKKDWHIWSLHPGGDGMQISPSFVFDANPNFKLIDSVTEHGKAITGPMDGVDGNVTRFENQVDFFQIAKITNNTRIKGNITYQVCDNSMCLPPKTKPFAIDITDAGGKIDTNTIIANTTNIDSVNKKDSTQKLAIGNTDSLNKKIALNTDVKKNNNKDTQKDAPEKSLLMLFIISFGLGIVAVFTPCIFSMIPITVSFFTKRSKTRAEGIKNALYYSSSIIIIFTVLGVVISAIWGSAQLNTLATDWRVNLFFFALFVVFGISFLGAFEISLPSSWTNATDSKAGVSSFGGIFFMALTLVIVSFSCTGPIVGGLLVEAGKGGIAGPAIGMLGFSTGLALPFALFAIFPGLVNKLAQSGGWLNQVKVVLGFIELMFALKYLSNADLAQGWRLLDREIFLAIWIVLALMLGVYLMGWYKLSHDDETPKNIYGQEYVGIFKLFLAVTFFGFAVYLIPGMWGAPLNGVSAFVPPMGTFDAFGGGGNKNAQPSAATVGDRPVKYVTEFEIYEPQVVKDFGLITYYDYDEAITAAKKQKKPIMLDFTGINCANCRKMESHVWSNPEVAKLMKEEFIIVSLYCDMNRIVLPKEQQYFSKDLNQQVATLGNKNADLQASKYNSNQQPIYFFVDENGNKLVDEGYSYNPDAQKFVAHLQKAVSNYKKTH